jgi:hypothetical protein
MYKVLKTSAMYTICGAYLHPCSLCSIEIFFSNCPCTCQLESPIILLINTYIHSSLMIVHLASDTGTEGPETGAAVGAGMGAARAADTKTRIAPRANV